VPRRKRLVDVGLRLIAAGRRSWTGTVKRLLDGRVYVPLDELDPDLRQLQAQIGRLLVALEAEQARNKRLLELIETLESRDS
jgi:hypothetical protein